MDGNVECMVWQASTAQPYGEHLYQAELCRGTEPTNVCMSYKRGINYLAYTTVLDDPWVAIHVLERLRIW